MSYPYIQNKTENGTTRYTYHYGPKHTNGGLVDYTYMTFGNPWDRVAPVYDVFAYSSNADDSHEPVWRPHPQLTHPKYSTVTIIFLSSLRILYEERSDDPIFPADEQWYIPGDPKPWFRNSDPRARPLACINTIEVCAADGTTCWTINEPTSNGTTSDDTPEFILLYSSLYKTDIYYSLAKRQGRALLAQKKVSQYFSVALGQDPWVAEVENLVRIALARTSINAWSVASGEDSIHDGRDGFTEKTKGYGNLCGRYKYNPVGYQSLRFVPLILVAMYLPFIWALSWTWKPIELKATKLLNRLRQPLRGFALGFRAQEIRARQSGGNRATRHPTSNPRSPSAAGMPQRSTSERDTAASSEVEASTTTAPQQRRQVQSQDTRQTTAQALSSETPEPSDMEETEWEPLVFHQLLYLLWFLTCLLVWEPLQFLWKKIRTVNCICHRRE